MRLRHRAQRDRRETTTGWRHHATLYLEALRGLAALALVHGAAAAQAAGYPAKPIVFIVPYTAGGTTDLVARTAGQKVAEKLGQPVIVENRPGAGGNIGMDAVAKAAPDGYTIGFGAISTNALNPFVYPSMPFDPTKDFTGISMLGASSVVLETGPSIKVDSVKDLVAYAKQHPGTAFGTPGTGTSMHLAGVMFDQLTGAGMQHIPYKGSAQGINDLLGGHLPIMFDNLPASLPHIKSGKVRALAVTGSKRAGSTGRADAGRAGLWRGRGRSVVRGLWSRQDAAGDHQDPERGLPGRAGHARGQDQAGAGGLHAVWLDAGRGGKADAQPARGLQGLVAEGEAVGGLTPGRK